MKRNVTILKLVYFFKSLWFFAPILTLFYLSRALTLFQIVSLESILILTILISEIPTGIFADRIGRKNSLICMIGLYILGNIITIYAQDYWLFCLTQVFFGIGLAFGSGAVEALVYDSLIFDKKEQDMAKVWGNIQAYSLIAGVIATAMGGFLAADQDPNSYVLLLWLYVIGASIAFVLTFFIKDTKAYKTKERSHPLTIIRTSWKLIFQNKNLRMIVLLSVFTSPFYHVMKFLIQPYFLDAHVEVVFFGLIFSVAMLSQALFSHYAHKIEKVFGMKKTVFIATILPAVIYIMLSLFVHPVVAIFGYIMFGGMEFFRRPLFAQYTNLHLPTQHRATLLSMISMIISCYLFFMRLVIGKIADYSITSAFLFMGIIILFGALLLRIDERHVEV